MNIQALIQENARIREDASLLAPLEQPTTVGRRLDVVGFVLGDSFDTILRNISEDYLRNSWIRLSEILKRHDIQCDDLSWGLLHNGENSLFNANGLQEPDRPTDYLGWTSCQLANLYPLWTFHHLGAELQTGSPSLRHTETWRALKWNIAPDDYPRALKLIEHICTADIVAWIPEVLLQKVEQPEELWHRIAKSFEEENQQKLDDLIEEARQSYTPLGFRLLLRGFGYYLWSEAYEGKLTWPELP